MITSAPAVDTERLSLRAYTPADLAESFAMWSDPEVTRYVGGKPSTHEEVWSRLIRYAGHWALLGFGYWVVRETATGRFVGDVGLADFKRDLEPSFNGSPEAGWVLAPWSHGKGYATEATRAALAWAEANLGAPRTVCMIDVGNTASMRVAEKCGFREWRRASYKGASAVLFER